LTKGPAIVAVPTVRDESVGRISNPSPAVGSFGSRSMEFTINLPFAVTLAVLLAGLVAKAVGMQGELKDQRREADETKKMVADIAPKLVDVLDGVTKLCAEVMAWKEKDHKALEAVERRTSRHTKRLEVLEKQRQAELIEELRAQGVPESLTAKLDTVGSWQAHDVSGEHVAAKGTV
jgi:hypothetical protein